MTVVDELPELAEPWSRDHWLRHCESYRVVTLYGPFGLVDEVLLNEEGEPELLLVRVGRFQTHLVVVPVSGVVEIRPEGEVVALRSVPRAVSQGA